MCNEKCVFSDVKKIKVSREVADAIETLGRARDEIGLSVNDQLHLHAERIWKSTERAPLNELSLEEFATALIVGYEVEMTPHQKIAKEYADAEQERLAGLDLEDTCLIYQNLGIEMGIEFTLNALGVVVEGVNDN